MIKFYFIGVLITSLLFSSWLITSLTAEVNSLELQNQVLKNNNVSLEEQVKFEISQISLHSIRVKEMSRKLNDSEKNLTYLRGVFNQHDFSKLLEKKPQLITNRMIKATEKVLKELENASR